MIHIAHPNSKVQLTYKATKDKYHAFIPITTDERRLALLLLHLTYRLITGSKLEKAIV